MASASLPTSTPVYGGNLGLRMTISAESILIDSGAGIHTINTSAYYASFTATDPLPITVANGGTMFGRGYGNVVVDLRQDDGSVKPIQIDTVWFVPEATEILLSFMLLTDQDFYPVLKEWDRPTGLYQDGIKIGQIQRSNNVCILIGAGRPDPRFIMPHLPTCPPQTTVDPWVLPAQELERLSRQSQQSYHVLSPILEDRKETDSSYREALNTYYRSSSMLSFIRKMPHQNISVAALCNNLSRPAIGSTLHDDIAKLMKQEFIAVVQKWVDRFDHYLSNHPNEVGQGDSVQYFGNLLKTGATYPQFETGVRMMLLEARLFDTPHTAALLADAVYLGHELDESSPCDALLSVRGWALSLMLKSDKEGWAEKMAETRALQHGLKRAALPILAELAGLYHGTGDCQYGQWPTSDALVQFSHGALWQMRDGYLVAHTPQDFNAAPPKKQWVVPFDRLVITKGREVRLHVEGVPEVGEKLLPLSELQTVSAKFVNATFMDRSKWEGIKQDAKAKLGELAGLGSALVRRRR